ncbi:unnamed protein product [Bemisia tabaci]|uniref:Uncharacterized protein n=1 Tax=Bemisia tabaci TaxID=7038 RepID=A0A9P0F9D1_BEMTA|nr:unnamed protein product [Bemisia tabaci]
MGSAEDFNEAILRGGDFANLDIIQKELNNCLARMKEEDEAFKMQFMDRNIHTLPENILSPLEITADHQIAQDIDEINDISILLSTSESVLNRIKQTSIQRQLNCDKRKLSTMQKQLDQSVKILSREERHYQEEKRTKEELVKNLKTKTVLLKSEMGKAHDNVEELENSIYTLSEDIENLHMENSELDKQISAKEADLIEVGRLPPSFTEADERIQELKEKIRDLDARTKRQLNG